MGFVVKPNESGSSDIPSERGYWSPSPNGFLVEVKVGSKTCDDVLIATGGELSTIDREEAERLELEIESATPLRVVIGTATETVSTISTSVAKFVGTINDVPLRPVYIRVIDEYNVRKIVLTMDWLIEGKIGLFFQPNRIFNQESLLTSTRETTIPTVIQGAEHHSPSRFIVDAKVNSKICKDVLIASGAPLSTIKKSEAERLGLQIRRSFPLQIIYNPPILMTTTVSTNVARFAGSINNVRFPPVDIRVVDNQETNLILGVDWLKETKVGLMFNPNRIYTAESLRQNQSRESAIPSVQGYWNSSPGGFTVEAKIGYKTCKDIIIATGAGISTIERGEAERLGLDIQGASPLRIMYGPPGHTVSTISNSVAKFSGIINNVRVPPVDIHVVDSQNIKLILGVDWMEEAKIGLLFNPNRIYIQENEGLEELLRRTRS